MRRWTRVCSSFPSSAFCRLTIPAIAGTVAAVERKLLRDGLVIRYDTGSAVDGLPPGEGAFLACSFWLVDNYVLLGRYDEACALFERLLALRNDLGLLAEEYDPHSGRQLGNFPQAFSHLALINSAHGLNTIEGAAHQRSQKSEPAQPEPEVTGAPHRRAAPRSPNQHHSFSHSSDASLLSWRPVQAWRRTKWPGVTSS